ncbi:UDP-N-acetylglucosamine 1-carboxyvinyltransferase [soil metagenome]
MEDSFIINGGKPLKGHVQLAGAKNASYKIIIAALLFDQEVIVDHVPRIQDVFELFKLIESLGGKASFIEENKVAVDGRGINNHTIDLFFSSKIRGSFMLFASLLYKLKEAHIPNPGGCRLGARSIDRIIDGMKQLGIEVEYESETGYYHAKMNTLPQGTYTFPKPSHTGTELLIMVSVLSKGNKVILENTAREPEVDDLINFFEQSGADIKREGTSIIINGVDKLSINKPYYVMSDRIEAMTYAVLGIMTRGEITVSKIKEEPIKPFLEKLREAGAGVEQIGDDNWKFFYKGPLKAIDMVTGPHPEFLTDWQPIYSLLMTQAEGEAVIHERVFENRFTYVEELNKLGADIEFIDVEVGNPKEFYHFNYDPEKTYNQAIRIRGPQPLHNGAMKMTDIRAGATLALAALLASGESIVNEVHHLERGYEHFVEKIQALGGDIKKI